MFIFKITILKSVIKKKYKKYLLSNLENWKLVFIIATMQINKVHNINFLDNMLPDKCANLIIADPPYFEVKGGFDFIWDTFNDYLKDVEKWAIECKRLLADNGTLFWYGHAKKIAYSQIILDKYFNLENSLVWEKIECQTKRSDFEQSRVFAPITERILMYSNEIDMTGLQEINNNLELYKPIREWVENERKKIPYSLIYLNKHIYGYDNNKDGVAGNKLSPYKQNWQFFDEKNYLIIQNWCKQNNINAFQKTYNELRLEYEALRLEYEVLRRPFNNIHKFTDVLKFSQESNISRHYDHPTQKPEKLTRALIQTCSRENDLVLVPFAGSGTECAMALKEKRNFVGFEIEPKYCEIANKRVSNELAKNTLF